MTEITSNSEFADRLIKLAEDFDKYDFLDNDGDDDNVVQENKNRIESDLVNRNDTWIRDWLYNIKAELNSKINKDDLDYLGHYIVECDALLLYLDC